MSCLSHFIACIILFSLLLIICMMTDVGNYNFQNVEYISCPNSHTAGGFQCISTMDRPGLNSIEIIGSKPRTESMIQIIFLTLITYALIIGLYCIIYLICYIFRYCICHNASGFDMIEKKDIQFTMIRIIEVASIVYFIIMFANMSSYDFTHREVICLAYEAITINDSQQKNWTTYIASISWKDNYNNIGKNSLLAISYRPVILPAPCWIDGTTATFYNPKLIYMYITIIYMSILASCIIFMVDVYFIYEDKIYIPIEMEHSHQD